MIKYYHRLVIRPRKVKSGQNKGNFQAWWVEEFVATDDIKPFNFRKQIRFTEIDSDQLPRALSLAEPDVITELWLAPKKKGQNTPINS